MATQDAPSVTLVDLGTDGSGPLAGPDATNGDRTSRTLFKADVLRIVLTALRAGARLSNDDPDETVAIQPLQGELTVTVGGQQVAARTGQLVCVAAGRPWEVRAGADSLLLLTVGRRPDPASIRE